MHIEKENSSWSFDGIANDFVVHARMSIPGYDQGHDLICKYSDFFCLNGITIVDIGCSTGLMLVKIAERHKNKEELKFIGIEPVEDMYEFACANIKDPRIELINERLENITLPKSGLITSYYTMQFVSPTIRQLMVDKIYETQIY